MLRNNVADTFKSGTCVYKKPFRDPPRVLMEGEPPGEPCWVPDPFPDWRFRHLNYRRQRGAFNPAGNFSAMEFVCVAMDEEGIITEIPMTTMPRPEVRVIAEHTQSDGTLISTAFTPFCLRSEEGKPMCFETVAVRDQKSTVLERYSAYDVALRGHDRLLSATAGP